jgi:CrcB protein
MKILVAIAVGGALGALLRYGLSGLVQKAFAGSFPFATLVVNVLGSFLIGVMWVLIERLSGAPNLRAFAVVGLLGAFTTFSTYSLEVLMLGRLGDMRSAILYLIASNTLCIAAVTIGFLCARSISTTI